MSTRNRVFIGILLIYVLGVAFLLYRIVADLDTRYRESAEESLVETSNLLATVIERDVRDGTIHAESLPPIFRALYARRFDTWIYALHKTQVQLRAYVTDAKGRLLFDSLGRAAPGEDYSYWRDVKLTLQGEYGARTTRDNPDDRNTSVMYVAAPIYWQNKIIGVATVGKPVRSFGQFVEASRRNIISLGIGSLVAILTLVVIVSVWLVRPFTFAADYVRYVRRQKTLNLRRLGRRALESIAAAYQEMRDVLAGRHYVSEYVQTLTHEIKGPLSAIRGAGELLQEKMPEAERKRFVANITRESQRIQELVDRLLELAALESRHRLERVETFDVRRVIDEALQAVEPRAAQRHVKLSAPPGEKISIEGDAFLVQRAVANLLENAIDFSPDEGEIGISVRADARRVTIGIRDRGPGIPEYARDKVFEKFYSLARPHSGKRSTGLGLAFVQEVAELHNGSIKLSNAPDGGTLAELILSRD